MAVSTKGCVPASITAGDTVIINTGADTRYPNTAWTLQFVLARAGKVLKSWNAASDSASIGFIITLPGTDTTQIAPGGAEWFYLFRETATGQRETGRTGDILISPNPTKSLPDSVAAVALKNCFAAINTIVSDPNSSANFNGQSYTSQNIGELFKARDRLQMIVDSELRALGLSRRGGAKLVLTRFR